MNAHQATLPNQDVYRDLRKCVGQDLDGFSSQSLLISISVELLKVGPQPRNLSLILHARESHFVSRNFCFGILHEIREGGLIPEEAGVLQSG